MSFWWRCDALLRFLLERMKDVDPAGELRRVDRPVRVRVMPVDDLHHVAGVLRPRRARPRPPARSPLQLQRHRASHCHLGGPAGRGRLPGRHRAVLPPPRSRPVYGERFRRRVKGLGISEVLTAPQSPWQNPFAERLIGSVRRDCLNHVVVLGERHLRRILISYFAYYHRARTHLSLDKDAPDGRPIEPPELGTIIAIPDRKSTRLNSSH